ncbi:retrovirus-related pol polyprotein from transposon TNT 1-94 [Tanacetum coccineum]
MQDSYSDVVEDTMSNSEILADLNVEFHDRALLANQNRFYKRSRRVGSTKKPMDKSNETCFSYEKLGHFQKDCPTTKTSTPSYPSSRKAPMIPKPFIDFKYYGFNDHHSDKCEYYPGCDICGSIAHETADYTKKPSSINRKPRIANRQFAEPTEK